MYPISFKADIPLTGRDRLSVLFRWLLAIPIWVVASMFYLTGAFAAIYAWFMIIFTGQYPIGVYSFVGQALRITARANAYLFLAVDRYPPFSGEDDPAYPIRIEIAPPPESYDRLKTGFRFVVGIPVLAINYLWGIILWVVSMIAWLAIVFTGKVPEGLVKPIYDGLAYSARAGGYFLLLTQDWPPYSASVEASDT